MSSESEVKVLTDKAKIRLKRDPKEVCNAARRGSESDVMAVANALQSKEVPSRLRDTFVAAIVDAIPHMDRRSRGPDGEIGWVSMAACVDAMLSLDRRFCKTRKKLEAKWVAVLPTVSAWAVFTLEHVFRMDMQTPKWMYLQQAFLAIRLVHLYIHEFPSIGEPLTAERVLQVATAIWLRQEDEDSMKFSSDILYWIFTGHACDSHSKVRYVGHRKTMFETATELGFSADDVVELALTRIRSKKEYKAAHLNALLTLLTLSPEQKEDPVFQRAFVEQDGVEAVLKVIRDIFSDIDFDFRSPNASKLTDEDVAILAEAMLVVHNMLQCLPSWTTRKHALESDLLRILALLSTPCILAKLGKNTKRVIRDQLEQILAGSMMVRQIFLATRKAVKKYPSLVRCLEDGEGSYMPPQLLDSELVDAWDKLFSIIRHHSRSFKAFTLERKLEEVMCENTSCSLQGPRSNFRKCAGCEVSYFCSLACQTAAWRKHDHKTKCIKTRAERGYSSLSILDLDYIARDTREAVRQSYFGTKQNGWKTYGGLGVSIIYGVEKARNCFVINFFDWDSVKRDEDPLVYRLGRGDTNDHRIVTVPRSASHSKSESATEDEEPEVEVIVKVKFPLGVETRTIYFSAPFSQALFEGRLCGCCRFHDDPMDHAKTCPVHSRRL